MSRKLLAIMKYDKQESIKVFTNGCFDLLHTGHIKLLKFCKTLAPSVEVVVGLNSDTSVKSLKGPNRPINKQQDRKLMLESIKYVDEVLIFYELDPYNLIKLVKPDIIVKGGDYKESEVIGNDLAEVRIFDYVEGYSTTKTFQSIADR